MQRTCISLSTSPESARAALNCENSDAVYCLPRWERSCLRVWRSLRLVAVAESWPAALARPAFPRCFLAIAGEGSRPARGGQLWEKAKAAQPASQEVKIPLNFAGIYE